MSQATEMVHDAGGLVIADEVQAGLCRTGMWWGYEREGFLPDIVSMGKPLGAGVPVSAVVSSRSNVEQFRRNTRYFNTFASSPLQAAAGNAVLDVLESENLCEQSNYVGEWMLAQVTGLLKDHSSVGDVRGKGLFIAVEWVKDKESKQPDRDGALNVVESLKKAGFLIGAAGKFGNVLKLRPPLVFNKKNAQEFVSTLDQILQD
jgi:4-aminobutyrate aminotransferase-like enzyme